MLKRDYRSIVFALLIGGLSFTACQKEAENEVLSNDNDFPLTENVQDGQIIPGKYIVSLKPNHQDLASMRMVTDYDAAKDIIKDYSSQLLTTIQVADANIERVYASAIYGFTAELSAEQAIQLSLNDRVLNIEPDRIIIMRPPWERDGDGGGDGGGSSTQTTPYGITRVKGGVTYTGNSRAWIIDTGIEYNHEDLNVDTNGAFTAFSSGPDASSANDLNGHGTHVAGTVAAIDNNVGVIGVAAGAKVVPVKVLDRRGSGSISGVIAGVDHVAANAKSGDVANMSLGGGASTNLDNAVKNLGSKGVKVAIAAGNSSADANNYSPARATGTNLFTVSAMDSQDRWASFSNFGNPPIRYCAPGVGVNSTWINNGYRSISGTSMAAPHVCGLLLLGSIKTDGFVIGDPDGNPDPIASR